MVRHGFEVEGGLQTSTAGCVKELANVDLIPGSACTNTAVILNKLLYFTICCGYA